MSTLSVNSSFSCVKAQVVDAPHYRYAAPFSWSDVTQSLLRVALISKQVSEVSFVRAMDASGIGLTRDELGLVISRYKIPGGGGGINYQKFCDQSNKVNQGIV